MLSGRGDATHMLLNSTNFMVDNRTWDKQTCKNYMKNYESILTQTIVERYFFESERTEYSGLSQRVFTSWREGSERDYKV